MRWFNAALTAAAIVLIAYAYAKRPSSRLRVACDRLGASEHSIEVAGRSHRYRLLSPNRVEPNRSYPLWVFLHGSQGSSEYSVLHWHDAASKQGAFLLAPQGSGTPAPEADCHDWDADRDVGAIIAMVDEVSRNHPIDRHRVALFGFSRGGWMAWRTIAEHPETFWFCGALASQFWQPIDEAGLRAAAKHVVMFFGAGQKDYWFSPPDNAAAFTQTAKKLRELGFVLETSNPADVGHHPVPFQELLRACYSEQETKRTEFDRVHSAP